MKRWIKDTNAGMMKIVTYWLPAFWDLVSAHRDLLVMENSALILMNVLITVRTIIFIHAKTVDHAATHGAPMIAPVVTTNWNQVTKQGQNAKRNQHVTMCPAV